VTGDSIMFNIQEGGGTRDNATMTAELSKQTMST